jgi:hypothetical protein
VDTGAGGGWQWAFMSIVALDLCGWKGVSVDGSGGDSSLCLHERLMVFVGAGSASLRALLGELCRGWALVNIVSAGGHL